MTVHDVVFPADRRALYKHDHYSPAVRNDGLLFVSDQVGSHGDGSPEPELETQVCRAFDNLNAVLAAVDCGFDDVLNVTVFVVDTEANFERIWKIVPKYWGEAPHPTPTAVGVNWPYGFNFGIEVVARLPEGREGGV